MKATAMATEPRIVYFVPELTVSTSGILHAQVLTPAAFLAGCGVPCFFVGGEESKEKAAAAAKSIPEVYGLDTHVVVLRSPKVPYFGTFRRSMKAIGLSRNAVQAFRPTHVYTRGCAVLPAAMRLARMAKAVCVFDVRGVAAEEVAINRGKGWAYRFVLKRELNAIREAHRVSCVSNNLREWIRDNTGRNDVVVIPSCVDPQWLKTPSEPREQVRARLGLKEDHKVICYSGGLGRWQRMRDIVSVFAQISNAAPSYRFLFLCREEVELIRIAGEAGLGSDRVCVVSCEHKAVASYLGACDAGIIMRDNTVVNRVASPVKVSEYLASGLPVILTRGIGDYSEQLPRAGVGLLLDEKRDIAGQVVAFVEQPNYAAIRRRAIAFVREKLTWDAHLDAMRYLFRMDE